MQPFVDNLSLFTFAERPYTLEIADRIISEGWPPFMLFDPVADRYWTRLYAYFPMTQFALYDASGAIAAICNSIPFHWDGDSASLSPRGWDWVLEKGMMDYEAGVMPNALSALSITIARAYLGQGLSARMVNALRDVARGEGLKHLVTPLRPMLKAIYPLTPMERYIRWKTPDGAPFDPWMRVHWRAGARIRHVCPESMRIPGSVSQWEEWTGIRFPESGLYVVPGALVPVEIHVEDDRGCYIEPNIWMVHTL